MHRSFRPTPARRTRPTAGTALLGAVASLLLVLGAAAPSTAGPRLSPTSTVVSLSTDNSSLGGSPTVPAVLARAGTPMSLTITTQAAGTTFTKDTTFALTAALTSGATPAGVLSPSRVVLRKGQSSVTTTVTYDAVDNGVVVTATPVVRRAGDAVPPSSTAPFDSLKRLVFAAGSDPALRNGFGADTCVQGGGDSLCGVAYLPNGIASPQVALASGACTPGLGCQPGTLIVSLLGDLGSAYSATSPARVVLRCAAALCGNKSIASYTVKMSFAAAGPLDQTVQPCVAKGLALDAAGHTYCTDYVSSSRDGGDLLLTVLLTQDPRMST